MTIIIILELLISIYFISGIICYGLMLPYMEVLIINYSDKPYKGRGIEKASIYLSLLGPVGLYSFVCATGTRYCGFRFYRKYVKYTKNDEETTKETS